LPQIDADQKIKTHHGDAEARRNTEEFLTTKGTKEHEVKAFVAD
jgi:hypothetical protein